MGKASEKAKITQEQAGALEETLKEYNGDKALVVEHHINCGWRGAYTPLIRLDYDDFIRAVYIGYDVEKDFAEGEWVTTPDGKVGRLVKVPTTDTANDFYIDSLGFRKPERRLALSKLRRASPEEIAKEKERRFFAKHGRERWELREGDVLSSVYNGDLVEVTWIGDVEIAIDGTYLPAKIIANSYRVVAFVEGRLD